MRDAGVTVLRQATHLVPFATQEARRKLGRVNIHEDLWYGQLLGNFYVL